MKNVTNKKMKIIYLLALCVVLFFMLIFVLKIDRMTVSNDDDDTTSDEAKNAASEEMYVSIDEPIGFSGRWFEKEIDGKNFM